MCDLRSLLGYSASELKRLVNECAENYVSYSADALSRSFVATEAATSARNISQYIDAAAIQRTSQLIFSSQKR